MGMKRKPTDHRGRDIQKEIESAIGALFDCHLLVDPSAAITRFNTREHFLEQWQEIADLYEDDEPRCSYSLLACRQCGQRYLYSYVGVYKDRWWVFTPISEEEAAEATALAETIPPGFDPYNTALHFAERVTKDRPYIIRASMIGLAEGQKNPYEEPHWENSAGAGDGLPTPLSFGPTM
jgi:hypothetical protein